MNFVRLSICLFLSCLLFIFLSFPCYLCSQELSDPFKIDSFPMVIGNGKSESSSSSNIWRGEKGEGFIAGTDTFTFNLGMAYGVLLFGGDERHDIVHISLAYGRMIGDIQGENHWYKGNFEIRGELLGGYQINSESDSNLGITPHLRYHFATGTSLIPYVDLGVGLMLTEIRTPDLGAAFQFNEQLATGVNYFVTDNFAINIEGRYMHISSASLSKPNKGVNTIGLFIGVNWFF